MPRLPDIHVLPFRQIFCQNQSRPKVCLVALGSCLVLGVDYDETYAPVTKYMSNPVILSTVVQLDVGLHQMDVLIAFLHCDLYAIMYMHIPNGLRSSAHSTSVGKLHKALYGLKQAPHVWHAKIDTYLITSLGFQNSLHDPCLYIRHSSIHLSLSLPLIGM